MTSSCIDSDTLVRYFGGSLSDQEMARVMEHLRDCPECLEKFASANNIMENDELTDWKPASEQETQKALELLNIGKQKPERRIRKNPPARVRDFLNPLRKLFTSSLPAPPLLSPVRSDTDASPEFHNLTRNIANFQIRVSLEQKREDLADIRIRLSHVRKTEHIGLILKKDGKTLRACLLRENHANFEDLLFGHYHLVLEKGSLEKEGLFFEIRKSGIYENDDSS